MALSDYIQTDPNKGLAFVKTIDSWVPYDPSSPFYGSLGFKGQVDSSKGLIYLEGVDNPWTGTKGLWTQIDPYFASKPSSSFLDKVGASIAHPAETFASSVVKVFTDPGSLTLKDAASLTFPIGGVGATIASDIDHPKDIPFQAGILGAVVGAPTIVGGVVGGASAAGSAAASAVANIGSTVTGALGAAATAVKTIGAGGAGKITDLLKRLGGRGGGTQNPTPTVSGGGADLTVLSSAFKDLLAKLPVGGVAGSNPVANPNSVAPLVVAGSSAPSGIPTTYLVAAMVVAVGLFFYFRKKI